MKQKIPYRNLIVLFSILIISFVSCKTSDKNTESSVLAIDKGSEAVGPYLTYDNHQNTVLCWTAKDHSDLLYRLKYSVFDSTQNMFGRTVTVTSSIGCSHSPESMAKVAFKSDGTIVAVFARRFTNESNPYAGAIYYSLSKDAGASWTAPSFLHSDTSHHYGRNFFDLATLKDGEVAAVWLDGRFGKIQKGSALFFAKTEKGKGFVKDSCLNKSTCECCRTDLLVDGNGNLHLAYRSIQFPASTMGSQVRDMVYISSKDNGKTFTSESRISNDNWKIEGCPHSGPSLAVSGNKVNGVWFTAAEGKPGIYFTASASGSSFQRRALVSADGRHPQFSEIDSKLVMVCEESQSSPAPVHQHHTEGISNHHQPVLSSKILLNAIENGKVVQSVPVTEGSFPDHHAVIADQNKKAFIAWVRENKEHSEIYYTIKDLRNDK